MSRVIRHSQSFSDDIIKQVRWYREHANAEVAVRYVNAIQATIHALARNPGLGRPRFQQQTELRGFGSCRVQRPYHRHLIFYRFDDETLIAERAIHGARDLPRRLLGNS